MPTNLPPEYFGAEKRYRMAQSLQEKIACMEEMLSAIPKHKGTDKLRADYRRQLSKMKADAQSRKGAAVQHSAFHIRREGAGQVMVLGATNTGKSSLVAALTNASPEVAETPYTTWRPTPGMMLVNNAQVQLVDLPPTDREFVEPQLFDLARRSDLILLVVDLQADPLRQLDSTMAVLEDNRIAPLHRKEHYSPERLLTFIPFIVVANKCDSEDLEESCQVFCELLENEWPVLSISALNDRNLEHLKQLVFEKLDIIRIYSKAPGQEPDFNTPFVMKRGGTVLEFAGRIHKEFAEKLKFAKVWGHTAFEGQMVPRDYILQDGDVIELHI